MREEAGDISFRKAISCLRHDWIFEFVFGEHSDMLHRALLENFHFGGTYLVQTDGGEKPLPPPAHVNESGSMLFVNAATHGPRSVGFEVVRKKQSSSTLLEENVYLTRIVRDDETGVWLSIANNDDLDLIILQYCTIITPGYKEHAFMLLRRGEFLRTFKRSEHHFDENAWRRVMAYRLFSTEWRQCPKCGHHGPSICGCKVNLIPKKSMFDTAREIENMRAHTGCHSGIAQVSMFAKENGQPIFSSVVKSRSEIKVLFDVDEKRWLATWAMNHAIKQRPFRLLQMALPDSGLKECGTLSSQDVLFSKASISLDLGDALGVFDDVLNSPRICKDGAINLSSMLDDVVDVHECALPSGKRHRASICATGASRSGSDESGSDTMLTLSEDNSSESLSMLLDRAIGDGAMEQTVLPTDGLKHVLSEPTSNWDESKCESNQDIPETHQAQLPQQSLLLQPTQQQQQPKQHNHNISLTITSTKPTSAIAKGANARRAVRIAPAPYSVRTEHVDANQRKLELRKARNRASAQRSNLKKKLALQKLKDDLKHMSKLEGELRTRERDLRTENLKLRAAMCR
eukprot:TRINITY_DN1465_c0_g1_i1.p1 TRINITY_DN1465_c0_g1~~TRINITY_DN1465_c0_g1_i1.p1  ORF type:complete len:573 (-),score=104.69 TRINITY_DN1465_c0_g1_i1:5904-7622(-)